MNLKKGHFLINDNKFRYSNYKIKEIHHKHINQRDIKQIFFIIENNEFFIFNWFFSLNKKFINLILWEHIKYKDNSNNIGVQNFVQIIHI